MILPKDFAQAKISGCRWLITPSWLSGSWGYFLYGSFVYSCHIFLISSTSVRPIRFLSYIVLIFAWNFPLVSLIFFKRSLVFPILLFSYIYLHWSLERLSYISLLFFRTSIQMGVSLFSSLSSLLFFSQLFVGPLQTTILPSCISFSGDGFDNHVLYNVTNHCP